MVFGRLVHSLFATRYSLFLRHEEEGSVFCRPGDDLLSHVFEDRVPSALRRLTAEFGMGSGLCHLATATRPAKNGCRDR
jgi:hypothetical protein